MTERVNKQFFEKNNEERYKKMLYNMILAFQFNYCFLKQQFQDFGLDSSSYYFVFQTPSISDPFLILGALQKFLIGPHNFWCRWQKLHVRHHILKITIFFSF